MAKHTTKGRKSRSAARFGSRYGRKSRKLVADLEEKSRASYDCPQCGRNRVTRTSTAIWSCSKCGYTFAGGSFMPETSLHAFGDPAHRNGRGVETVWFLRQPC